MCILGHTLNSEETQEILGIYFDWILDYDLVDKMVPFAQFEIWFTELSKRIEFSKNYNSEFEIECVETTRFKTSEEYTAQKVRKEENNVDFMTPECMMQ